MNRNQAVGMALLWLTACSNVQKVDSQYEPRITSKTYHRAGPVVCIDEAHYNAHTAAGKYRPFAALLEADGYVIKRVKQRSTSGPPAECKVFVTVNPAGGKTYKIFALNLPTAGHKRRGEPAFSRAEVEAFQSWVERGGSLLLVADHTPYGGASAGLAAAFGVDMSEGFTYAKHTAPGPNDGTSLEYSTSNGLLARHPITTGRRPDERVTRVITFTGQSLAGPAHATALLELGDSAVDYVPPGPELKPRPAEGRAQAMALEYGKGRVVVLGEAGMLTAQQSGEHRFGMQLPNNENEQFALNILHWLSRDL
jgi:hypothetical protein